jgi:hypothetical protein
MISQTLVFDYSGLAGGEECSMRPMVKMQVPWAGGWVTLLAVGSAATVAAMVRRAVNAAVKKCILREVQAVIVL